MPEFIVLTHSDCGKVMIRASKVFRFYREGNLSRVLFTDGTDRYYKETAEQILELLQPKLEEPKEAWRSMLPGGAG